MHKEGGKVRFGAWSVWPLRNEKDRMRDRTGNGLEVRGGRETKGYLRCPKIQLTSLLMLCLHKNKE